MSEITDWDSYQTQYEAEQNEWGLRKAEKKAHSYALPEFDNEEYSDDYPAFGSPEWIEKEKQAAKLDLRRFLGKRGLLENSAL
jgi:hypothetical protein